MRKFVSYFMLGMVFLSLGFVKCFAQVESAETSLYDAKGAPVAYIADDESLTIYLWSGEPEAYIDDGNVYGFNGTHLGWYKSGIIYDHDGEIVGATRDRFQGAVELSGIKSIKEIQPIKAIQEIAPIKPIFALTWSETGLKLFLMDGTD